MKLKKKGQITVFIILGILILLTIALFIYFRQASTVITPERVVPPELKPFDQYVGGCINIVARDGINLLGANGGFIRFPAEIQNDYRSVLVSNPLFPSIKTPLWHYRGETRLPSEEYMKDDLAYYINESIDECLQDLEVFSEQYNITELEPRKIEIDLTENYVGVKLAYRLELKSKADSQTTIVEDFVTNVPIRLKKTYELAREVMEEEIKDTFLERRTIDLIAMHPDIPYTDMEFTCTPRIWMMRDVEAKLKELLEVNLPLIRVEKTDYADIPKDQPYIKNNYVWQVTDLNYDDMHVGFTYDPKWDMQLNVNPNEGEFMQSNANQGFDIMSFLCIHLWHFTYDVKYPVMVTVRDDEAKDHEAFTFNYGMEVSVHHNMAESRNLGVQTFDFEEKAREEEFCIESPITNTLRVFTYENITYDGGEDHVAIDDVNISFTCIRFRCPLGKSDWQFRGAVSLLTADVPYCVNGILRAEKPGYEEYSTFVTTDSEKDVDVFLRPIIEKDMEVVKHYVFGDRVESEQALEEGQTAMITLKRGNFKSSAFFPPEEGFMPKLKLLAKEDYEYELQIYVMDEENILGGYKGNWTPSWNKMAGAKTLKFHTVEWPYTEDEEKLVEYLIELSETSDNIPEPEFVS